MKKFIIVLASMLVIGAIFYSSREAGALPNRSIFISQFSNSEELPIFHLDRDGKGKMMQSGKIIARGLNINAVASSTNRLYVTGFKANSNKREPFFSVVDSLTGNEIASFPVPNLLQHMFYIGGMPNLTLSPDGSRVYIEIWNVVGPELSEHRLLIFDTNAMAFLERSITISSGKDLSEQCDAIKVDPTVDNTKLYILCTKKDSFRVVDANTGTLISETIIPGTSGIDLSDGTSHVSGMVRNEKTSTTYISTTDGRIITFDTTSNTIVNITSLNLATDQEFVGAFNRIALSEDAQALYIAVGDMHDRNTQTMTMVHIISLPDMKIISSITPKSKFHDMKLDKELDQLYFLNTADRTLLVVDIASGTLIQEVTDIGKYPSEIVINQ